MRREELQYALGEVWTVYAELAKRPLNRSCQARTECCQFQLTGLTPQLTKGEALVAARGLRATGRRELPESADGACPTTVYCFCHSCLRKPYALKRVQAKLLDRAYLRLDGTPLWEERVGRSAALTRTPQGFPDTRPRQ